LWVGDARFEVWCRVEEAAGEAEEGRCHCAARCWSCDARDARNGGFGGVFIDNQWMREREERGERPECQIGLGVTLLRVCDLHTD